MTFNKSLAVFGLLASIATPAAAYDLSHIAVSLDEARARIGAWFGVPSASVVLPVNQSVSGSAPFVASASSVSRLTSAQSVAAKPAVTTVAISTVGTSGAKAAQTISTVAAVSVVPAATAQATAQATAGNAAAATSSATASAGYVSTALANAGAAISSGVTSFVSLVSPSSAGSAASKSNSVSKTAFVAASPKASVSRPGWSEAAADLATDFIVSAIQNTKAAATSVAQAVQETTSSAATAVSTGTTALAEAVQGALSVEAISEFGESISRNQLLSALIVGSQPETISSTPQPQAPAETAPEQPWLAQPSPVKPAPETDSGANTPGTTTPAEPENGTPTEEPPVQGGDTQDIVSGNGTVYYVDFAAGSDSSSGKSPAQAWKRAPGDSAATGNAASVVLKGGDTVRFKGGTAYRGAIALKHSGDVGNPIIYTGTGFGSGQAILDGADNGVSSVPCPSAAACGGASNWQSLRLVTYSEPKTKYRKLYDALGPLFEAQSPTPSDAFWDDDLDQFVTIPLAQADAVDSGRLENATLAAAAAGQSGARLALWVKGNLVEERAITSVSGNTIYFDAEGGKTYKDRNGKAAIVGSVRSITKPGLFAVIGTGKAVVYPRSGGGSELFIGSGRVFFNLRSQSNIMIHGFQFVRGTASRGTIQEGVGVASYSKAVSNIRIENNSFTNFSMQNGYGMVMLSAVTNLTIRNNRLINIEGGSGFRIGTPATNVVVENNVMRKLGRTGLAFTGVKSVSVRGNVISQMNGVHGNGMSFYEKNANVTVQGNCVFDSIRPLTFKGGGASGDVNNLRFIGNILVANDKGTSSTHSWGAYTRGVVFDGNVALGSKAGFILNAVDTDVTVTRNRMSGLLISGAKTPPAGWTVSNNDSAATFAEKSAATLQEASCSARGTQGIISVGAD